MSTLLFQMQIKMVPNCKAGLHLREVLTKKVPIANNGYSPGAILTPPNLP
jgi:hypothetical protein